MSINYWSIATQSKPPLPYFLTHKPYNTEILTIYLQMTSTAMPNSLQVVVAVVVVQ